MNIFNGDNSSIAYINTQHCQIIKTIAYIILKVKSMIKKPKVANYASLLLLLLQDLFLFLDQFYCNTSFIISNLQKYFHQYNMSFVCFQFCKHDYLKILTSNIFFAYQ